MSFIEDYASIAAAVKAREEEKKPVQVTEGKPAEWEDAEAPSDWTHTVYGGMYGWPNKAPPDLTSFAAPMDEEYWQYNSMTRLWHRIR